MSIALVTLAKKLKTMKILRLVGIVLLAAIIFFGLFLIYSTLTCYKPEPKEIISENTNADTVPYNTPLNIISWNIGYAGLGNNMDFFYDSGKKVRDTYDRTLTNLDSISTTLSKHLTYNFFLLQEVDIESRRTYSINEVETITKKVNYYNAFAPNYIAKFVPIPPTNPMGGVYSGLLSISNYTPTISIRYQYPGSFGWPSRIFNLKRCMLVNRYPTKDGKELILINSHLSAFDDGSLKKQEMDFVKLFILEEYSKGNYVVVGGDWNQSPPKFSLTTFGSNYKVDFFILSNVDSTFMPKEWHWVYDKTAPTNRYLNEPYQKGKTFRSILDFFLASPNIEVVSNKTIDLEFANSDHNPVTMCFQLKKQE